MARCLTIIVVFCCAFLLESPSTAKRSQVQLQRARAAVDATAAWNQVCTEWGFPQAPISTTATFAEVWTGNTTPKISLQQAIHGVENAVDSLLGLTYDPDGDATIEAHFQFNDTIQNWD